MPGVLLQVHCQSFNGDVLYEPWEVLSDSGQPFTCFQDFWDRYSPLKTESIYIHILRQARELVKHVYVWQAHS